MINNWNYKNLHIVYSNADDEKKPSDIDFFYIKDTGMIIFGEIKNISYKKELWEKQKKLYEKLVDNCQNAMFIFIIHDKFVQNGDTTVYVPDCYIKEFYYNKEWHKPTKATRVKDIL